MFTAVPPFTWPTVSVACLGVNSESGSASRSSCSARSASIPMRRMATILAEAPSWVWLEWASWPRTVTRKVLIPLWPLTASILVGSPTTTRAGLGSSLAIIRIMSGAPIQPTSSS